ncbi:hypothetical protein [Streptomyces gilvosporeus]|uniref:Uncharacterized protein n=1 Tax=Streptomyces gilvosporeus TaxID=553510 RepID=A0A1V0U2Z3_9ACTN|nr:hypothetical protein [Streptomyces gilvosporeus]ARF59546.1 hypothetical protein B1H19_18370 [Streptomyces gilvosporeus]
MRTRLLGLLRARSEEKRQGLANDDAAAAAFAARIRAELAEDLPEDDLDEDLADILATYERGSRPGTDEDEHEECLEMVREALERIERGY